MTKFLLGAALLLAGCTTAPTLPGGAAWDPAASTFRWPGGEGRVASGLQYNRIESDTFEGEFVAKSGRLVIHHDIGTAAGAWAQRRNADFFEERTIEGARVWIAERKRGGQGTPETLAAVTFPDNGCANFFVITKGPGYLAAIQSLAASFRPRATAKDLTGRCDQHE